MNKGFRTADKTIYVLLALYLLSFAARYIVTGFPFYSISAFICCTACIVWMFSVKERIIDRLQRRLFYAIGMLILFLHICQQGRYYIFDGTWMDRQLWYAYYIPFLAIPMLSVCVSLSVGRSDDRSFRGVYFLLIIPSVVLSILVQTNDLHQLVFSFNDGFRDWAAVYNREAVFYLIMAWTYGLMMVSFAIIVFKCFKSIPWRYALCILIIPVLHYGLTIVLYSDTTSNLRIFGQVPVTVPMLYNMTFVILWEMIIRFGLIPSNSDYDRIFDISSLSAVITDADGNPVHRSHNSANIPEVLKGVTGSFSVLLDDNRKIYSVSIPGGRIFWEEDVTAIEKTNRELKDVVEQLSESNDILAGEADLKAERARLDVESQVYDVISTNTKNSIEFMENILDGVENIPDDQFAAQMARLTIPGVYVKRYSNLILMNANGIKITPRDLILSFSENLEYMSLMGVSGGASLVVDGTPSNAQIIRTYELVDILMENVAGSIRSVRILVDAGDGLAVRIFLEVRDGIETGQLIEKLPNVAGHSLSYNNFVIEESDDTMIFITLRVNEEAA